MSTELQSFTSDRIYCAVDLVEQKPGDIDIINLGCRSFYLKDEVDAVIAKLEDKIQQKDFFWEGCGFSKMGFKNTIGVANYVDKLKYKRCLAMANGCADKIKYWHIRYKIAAGYDRSYEKWKHKLLIKWHNRWLTIAKKFK